MSLEMRDSEQGMVSDDAQAYSPAKIEWTSSWRAWIRKHYPRFISDNALVLTVLTIALIGCFSRDKIKFGDGFGMDGKVYGVLTQTFHQSAFVQGLDGSQIQRILPFAIVYYSLKLLFIPRTNANIILAFGILNAVLIAASAFVWCLIANHLKISFRGKWLGFMGLFLNYALIKFPSYYPVLTDVPAFAISLLMLYFYLTDRRLWLIVLTLMSAFAWPTLIYEGIPLIAFPKDKISDQETAPAPYRLNIVLAVMVALVTSVYMLRLWKETAFNLPLCIPPINSLLLLSAAVALLYLIFGVSILLNWGQLYSPKYLLKRITRSSFLIAFVLFFLLKWLVRFCARTESLIGMRHMIDEFVSTAVAKPGIFYVSHIIYYGPILILAFFCWRPICRVVHQYGVGLTLCVMFGLLLSLNSESRHLINFFPLVVPFAVKVADSISWRPAYSWFFALFSVILSKVWLVIGGAPIYFDPNRFPDQLYYMSLGPYMSHAMYLLQGSIVIAVSGLTFFFFIRPRKQLFRDLVIEPEASADPLAASSLSPDLHRKKVRLIASILLIGVVMWGVMHGIKQEFPISALAVTKDSGTCYMAALPASHYWLFENLTDSENGPYQAETELFEDDKPLGPDHSLHDTIHSAGSGRFLHWGSAFYFSSSDNSDPRTNGRHYRVVITAASPILGLTVLVLCLLIALYLNRHLLILLVSRNSMKVNESDYPTNSPISDSSSQG